ncbi:LysR family transcriptional regulator [Epidermidibacterium keratini]|uniref:LysR family transcriptional regulator n=1 Tax=Epidermidibacterium keratini TaxID=1891644 RepID=A0A7L4YND7_9ACTN|nr:LysR family transcriptional regulator [Epidermidibacterium keratini]QHC00660.1 LysR family transcriptional regulator [Epidermidibacterium keratini]
MELQQLRYVLAVAEHRNFTRAAEQCFVAQSALSHQVKALEKELGVTLFARTSRRVDVTAAGEAFLPAAQACLDAAARAASDAAGAVGQIRGPLRIGAIPTVTALDLPAVLGRFRAAHPQVQISLAVGASEQMQDDLEAGRLDVALLGLAAQTPPYTAHRVLDRHRLTAIVSTAHRLAGRRRVRLADLVDEPFVDFPVGSSGRAQSELAFAAAGLVRTVAFEATTADLMLGLVEHNLAVAMLAPGVVPAAAPVVRIAVTDGPERLEYLAWNEFNPSPAARAFLDLAH